MSAALEWNVGRSRDGTVATGTSSPNGWGVVDIIGNAAEYVADCWIAPPAEPHGDGRLTATGDDGCQTGIVRGGSWRTPWKTDLLGHRERTPPANTVGFRVARDVTLTEAQRFEENTGISEILRHAHQRSRKRSE
jgi:formylglycine-generating enzyme required for sulfatase activity